MKDIAETFLAVHWIRFHAPSAGGWIRFLLRELDPPWCNWRSPMPQQRYHVPQWRPGAASLMGSWLLIFSVSVSLSLFALVKEGKSQAVLWKGPGIKELSLMPKAMWMSHLGSRSSSSFRDYSSDPQLDCNLMRNSEPNQPTKMHWMPDQETMCNNNYF